MTEPGDSMPRDDLPELPRRKERMPLTPSFLIAAAGALVGVKEVGGANRGPMVDRFLALTGLKPGYPWCAAFVAYVGYWSHYDNEANASVWPLPKTASCWELGHFARAVNILETDPHPGDVFLIYSPEKKRFAHTGIVASVLGAERRPNGDVWHTCITIEGNTNEAGSREGEVVARRARTFYPAAGDRFIRWVRMDRREDVADPRGAGGDVAA